jgi:hypothetical protein
LEFVIGAIATIMFTTIITDCKGENEAGRQISRFNSFGLGPTNLIGVGNGLSVDVTIEAAGDIVDILDATEGVVVVNVAPRGNIKIDGENGSSFSYFYHKDTLVISTIKGYCLYFVKEFGITDKVNVLDLKAVLGWATKNKLINKDKADRIIKSQFRSFEFVPRVARWLTDGYKIPSEPLLLTTYYLLPAIVWHIDAFGNCKTTLLTKRLKDRKTEKQIKTNLGIFNYYERLKDVPKGETAIYTGSSGSGDNRFLEIATQGVLGSAAKKLGIKLGDRILLR